MNNTAMQNEPHNLVSHHYGIQRRGERHKLSDQYLCEISHAYRSRQRRLSPRRSPLSPGARQPVREGVPAQRPRRDADGQQPCQSASDASAQPQVAQRQGTTVLHHRQVGPGEEEKEEAELQDLVLALHAVEGSLQRQEHGV